MFRRNPYGVQSLNILKRWTIIYCTAVLVGFAVLCSFGRHSAGVLLIGAAFCIFAAIDVGIGMLTQQRVGKLRTIFAILTILAAFGGTAILIAAYASDIL